MNTPLASEEQTREFLHRLWYGLGYQIIDEIAKQYNLNEEQKDALQTKFLKPGDWVFTVGPKIE